MRTRPRKPSFSVRIGSLFLPAALLALPLFGGCFDGYRPQPAANTEADGGGSPDAAAPSCQTGQQPCGRQCIADDASCTSACVPACAGRACGAPDDCGGTCSCANGCDAGPGLCDPRVWALSSCGATGPDGPTQAMCDTAYAATSVRGLVDVAAGKQTWKVPRDGTYKIVARGAGHALAFGAEATGVFRLTKDSRLSVIVGQAGIGLGGCGASAVSRANRWMVVAGGAGGAGGMAPQATAAGSLTAQGASGGGCARSDCYDGRGGADGGGGGFGYSKGSSTGYVFEWGQGGGGVKQTGFGKEGPGESLGGSARGGGATGYENRGGFGGGGQGGGGPGGGGGYSGGGGSGQTSESDLTPIVGGGGGSFVDTDEGAPLLQVAKGATGAVEFRLLE